MDLGLDSFQGINVHHLVLPLFKNSPQFPELALELVPGFFDTKIAFSENSDFS